MDTAPASSPILKTHCGWFPEARAARCTPGDTAGPRRRAAFGGLIAWCVWGILAGGCNPILGLEDPRDLIADGGVSNSHGTTDDGSSNDRSASPIGNASDEGRPFEDAAYGDDSSATAADDGGGATAVVSQDGAPPDAWPALFDGETSSETVGLGVFGQPCSPIGAYACAGRAQKGQLICNGVWMANGTCNGKFNCDGSPGSNLGSCQPIVHECLGKNPGDLVCSEGKVVACGQDLVTTILVEMCGGEKPACVAGACVACTPNPVPTRCSGSTPQFCNASSLWQDQPAGPCSAATPACLAGACVACVPNSIPTACADKTPRFCNASGSWQDRAEGPCSGATPACVGGACVVCTPNDVPTHCSGSMPQYCDGIGAWHDRVQGACPSKSAPVCESGSCRPPRALAVHAGSAHSCVLLESGFVKCWGQNDSGQLGLGDTKHRGDAADEMGGGLPALELGSGRRAASVSVGNAHSCALLDNGQVKCWGANNYGQLGLGDTSSRGTGATQMGDGLPAVNLGTGRSARAIAAGGSHTCALLDSGQVKCWGYNNYGQLGLGDTNSRGTSTTQMGDGLPSVGIGTGRAVRAIAAGAAHTCALLDNKQVKCWGYNNYGQLGLGDNSNRGIATNQMGDNLSPVDLGVGQTATAIAVGGSHTCALLDSAQMKCWGHNGYGQLGLGDTSNRGTSALGNLPVVNLGAGRSATAITAGGSHTCALLDHGQVKCWGYNNSGQLGLGDTSYRGTSAAQLGEGLPAVNLGTNRTANAIAAGVSHTCVLLDDAQVKCWGYNNSGQLGLGDVGPRGDAAGEMGDGLPAVMIW